MEELIYYRLFLSSDVFFFYPNRRVNLRGNLLLISRLLVVVALALVLKNASNASIFLIDIVIIIHLLFFLQVFVLEILILLIVLVLIRFMLCLKILLISSVFKETLDELLRSIILHSCWQLIILVLTLFFLLIIFFLLLLLLLLCNGSSSLFFLHTSLYFFRFKFTGFFMSFI